MNCVDASQCRRALSFTPASKAKQHEEALPQTHKQVCAWPIHASQDKWCQASEGTCTQMTKQLVARRLFEAASPTELEEFLQRQAPVRSRCRCCRQPLMSS